MSRATGSPTRVTMLVMNDLRHDARVRKEATTLARQGLRVTVYGMSEPGQSYQVEQLPFGVVRLPYRTKNWPKWRILWPVKYAECVVRMVMAVVRSRPDVIHAHDLDMFVPANLARVFLRRARLIYDSHELWTERVGVPFRGLWRQLERFLLPMADAVIAANQERANVMHHEYGAPTLPYVVENCPEITDLAGDNRLRAFVDSQGHVEKHILLYQGHIMEGRDLHLLVELAAELGPPVVLAFVGYGTNEYKDKLRDHALKLGCADRVLFHEPVAPEELVSFTSSADISVAIYPNTCRNNCLCAPNKLYESLMAGLIVVASKLPPIVRVLHDNRVGLAVDFTNPKVVARSLHEYLDNPAALQQAKQRARELALTTFNWGKESEQLLALYQAICTEGDTDHDQPVRISHDRVR